MKSTEYIFIFPNKVNSQFIAFRNVPPTQTGSVQLACSGELY